MWAGLRSTDVAPSPKSHSHCVGLPLDVSVNCTASGAAPDVGVAENPAVGGVGNDVSTVRYVTTAATDCILVDSTPA